MEIGTKLVLSSILSLTLAAELSAQNCQNTSVGFTPLNDLGAGLYQGFPGGLYPGGLNQRPAGHEAAGLVEMQQVVPRDGSGQADALNGRIVLLSIGMSNTRQEFGAFANLADGDGEINDQVILFNGAQGGWTADEIADPQASFWSNIESNLQQAGLTPLQVQAVWFKEAYSNPQGSFPQHAQSLQTDFMTIMNVLRDKYPNLRLCYCASRIYAGYATGNLNPEPYAYESGFSVKWLIEEQLNGNPQLNFDPNLGPVEAPWIAWGPYLWADGLTPRSDGLIWECQDFQADGTHPSADFGAPKVAAQLMAFFKQDSTTAAWFLGDGGGGEVLLLSQRPLRRGRQTEMRVRMAQPGETIYFLYSLTGTGQGPCPATLGGLCLDLLAPIEIVGNAAADQNGEATLSFDIPADAPLIDVHTQAVAQRGPGGDDSVKSNALTAPILP
ncbi:MAG: hypothetical protein DWQ01_21130 [Planctomycetota bacterium]|nr:MAG: hypothetical protein DWQ01_21130 [Planctomycetota bacterium]